MKTFNLVVMSLIVVSFFSVACNKSSDHAPRVGKGTERGGKALPPAEQAKLANDQLTKMSPTDKAFVERVAKDVIQLRNMSREMDALFSFLWSGYLKSGGRGNIENVSNVFRTLELALKSHFSDIGLPLAGPALLFNGQVPQQQEQPQVKTNGPVQQKQGSTTRTGRKSQPQQPVQQPQQGQKVTKSDEVCKGQMFKFEVTARETFKDVEMPLSYRISRLGCSGNTVSIHALADITMKKTPDKGIPYAEIIFNKANLAKELGVQLSMLPLPKNNQAYCTLIADKDNKIQQLTCVGIGQDISSDIFSSFEPLTFIPKAEKPITGKVVDYAVKETDGSLKPTIVSEKVMDDAIKTGLDFVFRELPLKPVEKIADSTVPQKPEEQVPPPSVVEEQGQPAEGTPAPVVEGQNPTPAAGQAAGQAATAVVTGEQAVAGQNAAAQVDENGNPVNADGAPAAVPAQGEREGHGQEQDQDTGAEQAQGENGEQQYDEQGNPIPGAGEVPPPLT